MTLTSIYNIYSPGVADGYPNSVQLGAMAQSVDNALQATFGASVPVWHVADITERAAKWAEVGSPCVVFRDNATPGTQIEYSTDGSTWHVMDTRIITATGSSVFTPAGSRTLNSANAIRSRGVVTINMSVGNSGIANGEQNTTIGTLATDFWPVGTFGSFVAWMGSGGVCTGLIDASTGVVSVRWSSEANTGGMIFSASYPGNV